MAASARTVVDDKDREVVREDALLRAMVATLRDDVADLPATAKPWQQLYETAIRRCAERDGEKV